MLRHYLWNTSMLVQFLAIMYTLCVLNQCVICEDSIGIDFDSTPGGASLIRGGRVHQLADGKPNVHNAITVTKIVYIDNPMETDAAQLDMCPTISDYTPRRANPGGSQSSHTEKNSYSRWLFALFKPAYLVKSVTLSLFTYLFRPIFFAAVWAIRVLVFRPAIFIYLLFLERPFQALLSFVLWILPMLAFITAITLVAIVIGGTFGWFSAVAVGAINAASPDDTHPYTSDKSERHAPSTSNIPQRVKLVFSDEQGEFSDSRIANTTSAQHQPEDIWTRRRGAVTSLLD